MTTIEAQIQAALEEAHALCDRLGAASAACSVAWDTVEELQAEAEHQRQTPKKSAFQEYCEANPDADECRLYED